MLVWLVFILLGLVVAAVAIAVSLHYLEKSITLLIVLAIAAGSSTWLGSVAHDIGLSFARSNKIGGYTQFYNGSLVSAEVERITCTQDGRCQQADHSCDPYTYLDTEVYLDANGNSQTRITSETRYHSCPFMTEEYVYSVTDTFGNVYPIGDHVFAADPVVWRDHGVNMKGSAEVPRGVPAHWQDLKEAIDRGETFPVTVPVTYDNYILASEDEDQETHTAVIKQLKQDGLLPEHTFNLGAPIYDFWKADKMSFVDVAVSNLGEWQGELMQLNAALGMARQGDLHVVAIKASQVSVDADSYLQALKAYWQSDLGKNAIAKNGIILVLGVDDGAETIEWAAASTGMPIGNDDMLAALQQRLKGQPFTLGAVFGSTRATLVEQDGKKKPVYTSTGGIVPQIILTDFPFQRACMDCTDEGNGEGFVHLAAKVTLEGLPLFLALFFYLLCLLVLWMILVAFCVYLAESSITGFSLKLRYYDGR